MRRLVPLALVLALALAPRPGRAGNVFVPLTIQETAGTARLASAVTAGVPLPPGRVRWPSMLRVRDPAGQVVPAQFDALATWPDGSVKWILADFVADAPAGGTSRYAITQDPFSASPAPPRPVVVTESPTTFTVDTGVATFVVSKQGFHLFDSVRVGATDLVASAGTDIVLSDDSGNVARTSQDPTSVATLEESGPLRAAVRVDGTFTIGGGPFLAWTARLHFFAGRSTVRAFFTLRNGRAAVHPGNVWDLGSSGSRYVEDLSLGVKLADTAQPTWTAWGDPTPVTSTSPSGVLYQESSGGNRWNWDTHVNRFGVVPMTFRGWQVRGAGPVRSGDRARGILDVSTPAGGVTISVRHFWQNFPKALRATGAVASVGLFPAEFPDVHEIQGGEEKTHEVLFYFHEGDATSSRAAEAMADLAAPLHARPPYEDVARTQAVGNFGPRDDAAFPDYENTVQYVALDRGASSFFTQREQIDEYGWRNFGEAYADHETNCLTQCCPISHDNNQYDYDWAALLFWIRNGEHEWFDLGEQGVRHLLDIDVYHTSADTPVYDHGLFWHTTHDTNAFTCTHRTYSSLMSRTCTPYLSGGPALDHLYTEGLLLYGYLTGDRRAFEVEAELEGYLQTRYAADAPTPGSGYEPRAWANALRAAVASYRRTWDPAMYALCRRIVGDSDAAQNPAAGATNFGTSMLMVSLGRFLEMKAERGELRDADAAAAFGSLEGYAARVQAAVNAGQLPFQDVLDFRYSEGCRHAYKFAPQGDPNRAAWQALGRQFFLAGESTGFFNTYIHCKNEAHTITNGELHTYFERGRIPADVTNLRVRRSGADVVLTWDAVSVDVHANPIPVGEYRVHRAVARPTRFTDLALGSAATTIFVATGDAATPSPTPLLFYELRAVATPGIEGY